MWVLLNGRIFTPYLTRSSASSHFFNKIRVIVFWLHTKTSIFPAKTGCIQNKCQNRAEIMVLSIQLQSKTAKKNSVPNSKLRVSSPIIRTNTTEYRALESLLIFVQEGRSCK